MDTWVLVDYGSLMSKAGLLRDGAPPHVHRAWAIRLPGRRGFGKRGTPGSPTMDARLAAAEGLSLRRLEGFVEGTGRVRDEPRPPTTVEPTFEGIALEVDRDAWAWFAERQRFAPGLAEGIASDAARSGRSVPAFLAGLLADAGLEGWSHRLAERYRLEAPASARLPVPVRLPETDDTGDGVGHTWAVAAATAALEAPLRASAAATQAGPESFAAHYAACVLGAAHGLDVRDIVDPAYEARSDVQAALRTGQPAEAQPLPVRTRAPPAAAPPPRAADPARGMRPLGHLVRLDDALDRLDAAPFARMETTTIPLEEADGRVLAADIVATADVPGFAKCAMDGYAVRAADLAGAGPDAPKRLRVAADLHAGARSSVAVTEGAAVQVATGAVLPEGADAVVMVERTHASGDGVEIRAAVAPGDHVIARGSDIARGDAVLPAGARLGPSRLAVLASLGLASVPVRRRPRVAVMPTGDEVVPVGATLGPGQVHDSNAHALVALARRVGADARRVEVVPDDEGLLDAALRAAVAENDVVVVTGGTSAGSRDLLPTLLAGMGRVLFHGVRIRPGKPVVAAEVDGRLVLGLPGYPTSCVVTAELLLVPHLARLVGERRAVVRSLKALAGARIVSVPGLRQFVPVRLDPDRTAHPVFRGSSAVTSLSDADGLVDLAEDVEVVPEGTEVLVRLLT